MRNVGRLYHNVECKSTEVFGLETNVLFTLCRRKGYIIYVSRALEEMGTDNLWPKYFSWGPIPSS